MPKAKSRSSQRAKEIKSVRKLRDAGLISKSVRLNTKPTRAVKSALRKFADVITGKASVVKVPPRVAKGLKGSHRVKGNLVVIARQPGERLRYDPNAERIVGKRRKGNKTFERTIERDLAGIRPGKAGTRRYYVVPFQRGGGDIDYLKFDTLEGPDGLEAFMAEYEKKGYKNWKNYVETVDVENKEDLEDMRETFPALDTYTYKVPGHGKVKNRHPTIIRKLPATKHDKAKTNSRGRKR